MGVIDFEYCENEEVRILILIFMDKSKYENFR